MKKNQMFRNFFQNSIFKKKFFFLYLIKKKNYFNSKKKMLPERKRRVYFRQTRDIDANQTSKLNSLRNHLNQQKSNFITSLNATKAAVQSALESHYNEQIDNFKNDVGFDGSGYIQTAFSALQNYFTQSTAVSVDDVNNFDGYSDPFATLRNLSTNYDSFLTQTTNATTSFDTDAALLATKTMVDALDEFAKVVDSAFVFGEDYPGYVTDQLAGVSFIDDSDMPTLSPAVSSLSGTVTPVSELETHIFYSPSLNAYFKTDDHTAPTAFYRLFTVSGSTKTEIRGQSRDITGLIAMGASYINTDTITVTDATPIPVTNAASALPSTPGSAIELCNFSTFLVEQLQMSGFDAGADFVLNGDDILSTTEISDYDALTSWSERYDYLNGLSADKKSRVATVLLYALMAPSDGIVLIPSLNLYAYKSGSTFKRLYDGDDNLITAPVGSTISSRLTSNEIAAKLPYYYADDNLTNSGCAIVDYALIYRGEVTYINSSSLIKKDSATGIHYVKYSRASEIAPVAGMTPEIITGVAVILDDSNGRPITGTRTRSWFNSAFAVFYNEQDMGGDAFWDTLSNL